MSLGRTYNVLLLVNKSKVLRPVAAVSASCLQQKRLLTSDPHKLADIRDLVQTNKPWPHRWFPGVFQTYDRARERLNENSKIIVVDGPPAVGKTEVAKGLAKAFEMKFVPDVSCDDLFKLENGFDLRELNDQLPLHLQFADFESLYKQPDPSKLPGIGRTHILLYRARYLRYAEAMSHVLNTGQGCVMVGGVHQEIAYARLLWKLKYFPREVYNYYRVMRDNSIVELWKPHVIVHYDAPVSMLRERINERNAPGEVNSPVFTDEYIQNIRAEIKRNHFDLRRNVEILKFDARGLDMDIMVEKLEMLNLTPDILFDEMLEDWKVQFTEDYDMVRMIVSNKRTLTKILGYAGPLYSKANISEEDARAFRKVVHKHPMVKYKGTGAFSRGTMSQDFIFA